MRAGINLLRNYSLQDPARRLTKNTFPGLMTLGDYGPIRIAIQGRVAAGKSHTQNNILKMLGDVASEGVSHVFLCFQCGGTLTLRSQVFPC